MRRFLALLIAVLFVILAEYANASSGPHPWAGAPAMFKKLMHEAVSIPSGTYRLRSAKTGEYMTMFSKGNDISLRNNDRGGGSDMGPAGQVFRIAHHQNSKYGRLYSIHHPNHSGNDKCISAGYSRLADTFAIMYMCRVETSRGGSGGVTSPGAIIRYDKQLWIFIPGSRGTVKIVAVAHLNNYQPRCVYPRHISGYGAMQPHWYQGLALNQCILDNKKGAVFNWHLERV